VTVEVLAGERPGVRLALRDLGDAYDATTLPGRHPLVEQAVASLIETVDDPPGLDVSVRSAVPPGASLGTSAAVVVAVLAGVEAALGRACTPSDELAARAHRVETDRAGRESGVQDHWAAACGGASLLAVGPYPEVRRTGIDLPGATRAALAERLVTVVLGSHDSSAVHREVIDLIVACGGGEHDHARRCFARLASLAGLAAEALGAGDLDAWAAALTAATDTQADLHAGLVGVAHRRAIEVARRHGALGWKVNGAGGEGGSLTALAPDGDAAAALRGALAAADAGWVVPALRPTDEGVRLVTR
jgi:D-glycero-alpha-D-manno-heptose-7-phosphate kinase